MLAEHLLPLFSKRTRCWILRYCANFLLDPYQSIVSYDWHVTYPSSFDRLYTCFPVLVILFLIFALHKYLDRYFATFQRLKMFSCTQRILISLLLFMGHSYRHPLAFFDCGNNVDSFRGENE